MASIMNMDHIPSLMQDNVKTFVQETPQATPLVLQMGFGASGKMARTEEPCWGHPVHVYVAVFEDW